MRALRLHGVGDLRLADEPAPRPGTRRPPGPRDGGGHLRLRPALVRRVRDRRRRPHPAAGPRPRGGRRDRRRSTGGPAGGSRPTGPVRHVRDVRGRAGHLCPEVRFLGHSVDRTGPCGSWLPGRQPNLVPLPDAIDDAAGAMLGTSRRGDPRPPPGTCSSRRRGRRLRLRADRAPADPACARGRRDDDRGHGPPAPPGGGRAPPRRRRRARGGRIRARPPARRNGRARRRRGRRDRRRGRRHRDGDRPGAARGHRRRGRDPGRRPVDHHELDRTTQGTGPALLAADEPGLSAGRSPWWSPPGSRSRRWSPTGSRWPTSRLPSTPLSGGTA